MTRDPGNNQPYVSDIEVSIVVPALNEADNLPELLRRVDSAMTGRCYEVLIVDDNSTDGTAAVCAELARTYPVSLHMRRSAIDGLSGAVLHGMSLARGKILAVMDADLQHPPECLPALLEPLTDPTGASQGDRGPAPGFILGSRYVSGGSLAEKWGLLRRFNSPRCHVAGSSLCRRNPRPNERVLRDAP